jgi:hypothetical protein
MTRPRILRRVIVPQAIRIVIPPTGNEFITLLKLTSLAYVISLHELLTASQVRGAADFHYAEAYAAAVVYYLVIVSVLMVVQAQLERRYTWTSAGRRRGRAPVVSVAQDADDRRRSQCGGRAQVLQRARGAAWRVDRGRPWRGEGDHRAVRLREVDVAALPALLEPVDSGSIFLESARLSWPAGKELAAHRSEIGMVFQRFNLFQNMTALGNVMCGLVEVRG